VPGVDTYDDLAWSFKLLWSTIRRIFPTDWLLPKWGKVWGKREPNLQVWSKPNQTTD
jgi:hypothetical protein